MNREIRRNVLSWAERRDDVVDPAEVEELRAGGMLGLKEWVRARGMDPAAFADDTQGRVQMVGGTNHPETGDKASQSTQERPWEATLDKDPELRASVDQLRLAQGDTEEERRLLRTVEEYIDLPLEQGVNEVYKVRFGGTDPQDTSQVGYFKSFDGVDEDCGLIYGHRGRPLQPVHEAAAWQLAKHLGAPYDRLVPTCVIREVGSQQGISGQLGSCSAERVGQYGFGTGWDESNPDVQAAGFFDVLTGQQDRHGANYFTMPGEQLALIDHGFTFPRSRKDQWNAQLFSNVRIYTDLTDKESDVLDKLLSSPDLHGARRWLEPERADQLQQRAQRMLTTGRVWPALGSTY